LTLLQKKKTPFF